MKPGQLGWFDLTVEDAEVVRSFYEKVVGWNSTPAEMDGYTDFTMAPPEKDAVAGICHKRGVNADVPSQWLLYISVANLEESMQACIESGGKIVCGDRQMGSFGRMCIIEDPAGAVMALFQPA